MTEEQHESVAQYKMISYSMSSKAFFFLPDFRFVFCSVSQSSRPIDLTLKNLTISKKKFFSKFVNNNTFESA